MNNFKIIRTLLECIHSKDELYSAIFKIQTHIAEVLKNCLDYCLNFESDAKDSVKLFEIEFVIDYLHGELYTGHWSKIPLYIRQAFTISCFTKTIIKLKHDTFSSNLLGECLKCLDLGLLLGAPLHENEEILTKSASTLSQEITKLNCGKSKETKLFHHKRKIENDNNAFIKLDGIEIDAKDCPSIECFNKQYFIPQKPVKLIECMSHWPASTKWLDVNYLLEIAGDRTVPIEIGSHYVDENWSQKLMTLKEFISNHYLSDSGQKGYLAQHNLFEQITELKNDICIPEYCCLSLDYENSCEPDINAWFGPKGTVSPLHQDPKNNILAQVYGTKQLILYSPEDTKYLYPHEGDMLSNTAQVNPVEPDFDKFPEFNKAKMYKCILGPGEMLFIPLKWWHHVTALDKSFSVSFWWQ